MLSAPCLPQQQPDEPCIQSGLRYMASVQHLEEVYISMQPSAVLVFTGLTHLCLESVRFGTADDSPYGWTMALLFGNTRAVVLEGIPSTSFLQVAGMDCAAPLFPPSGAEHKQLFGLTLTVLKAYDVYDSKGVNPSTVQQPAESTTATGSGSPGETWFLGLADFVSSTTLISMYRQV